jgi:TPR repeat protein
LLFSSGGREIRAMPHPILTLGTYEARPGCEEEVAGILRTHVARLRELGLVADAPHFAAARADAPDRFVESFWWEHRPYRASPALMAPVAAALAIALAAPQKAPRSADVIAALQTACAGEDPRACAELARRYRAGDGVGRDPVKAVRAAQDGCEAGEPALCVEAGRSILRGEGVKPDAELARRLFAGACTHRTQAGCLDLALMLQNGDGVAQDAGQATALFDKACQGGDAAACSLYGDARYMGSGAPKDARTAEAAYRRACELELYAGCTKLGDLFRMRHEAARAAAQYRKACAADEKDACTALALEKGCSGREACLDFADLCSNYLSGYDVLSEPALARGPCEIACAGGIGEACDNLADMYQDGYGVPYDLFQAAELRRRACQLGDRDACDVRE